VWWLNTPQLAMKALHRGKRRLEMGKQGIALRAGNVNALGWPLKPNPIH
jgi:hypothetical protein